MNKTAIKNFAVWARNKLIAEIKYKAGLLGITDKEIKNPLPQSTNDVQFFDIGTKEPYSIISLEIEQRKNLVEVIRNKEKQSDYKTAYIGVLEEVAYTWFNRLIAMRFMEVNDYLPSRIRVLSSVSSTKNEPDLVTSPLDANFDYESYERDRILQLKHDNKLDELFRMLFIKQCNALNAILPGLFEKTNDYTELLLNVSFTDKDGVVYHLVHDIPEDDFNIEREGQVEIIGWLYQYYNSEPKDETFALLKKNVKITKERIPAATQLFTPDWIVRYMVENSLGRLWIEGHPNEDLKSRWKYYIDEAEQESEVKAQLDSIRNGYKGIKPEDIKVIDPCMGSGHILVYVFDVLMQIYESYGYNQRDAAKSIIENNLYGLDIDNRAYQLAYFAVMMKARQYNRRILNGETMCNVYAVQESNGINRMQLEYFGQGMSVMERNTALHQMEYLLDTMLDAKEYGSILKIDNLNWELLYQFTDNVYFGGQITLDTIGLEDTRKLLRQLVEIAFVIAQKYDVVVTNPPYLSARGSMNAKLTNYLVKYYKDSKNDLFTVFMQSCYQMAKSLGFVSMVNQHSWMFLVGFAKLREYLYQNSCIQNMLHIGAGAFDGIAGEVVQSVAFSIRKASFPKYKAVYLKMLNGNWKEHVNDFGRVDHKFEISIEELKNIPNGILCYWLGGEAIRKYYDGERLDSFADPRVGLATGENEKFVRIWTEVDNTSIGFGFSSGEETQNAIYKWYPYNKGGECRRWYGNREHVVNWGNNGRDITNYKQDRLIRGEIEKKNSECWNREYYFKESISWSKVSSGRFAARYYETGFVFDVAGCSILGLGHNIYFFLAALNSELRSCYIESLSPTLNFETGAIKAFPIIYNTSEESKVENIAKSCISIAKNEWDSYEASWDFLHHPFLNYRTDSNRLSDSYAKWEEFTNRQFSQLKSNEEELNYIFINIYGLHNELTTAVEDKDITLRKADLSLDARSFISYAVGCMFGRYSLDMDGLVYAGGEWHDNNYSTFIPVKDNVIPITDEEYFEDDIVGLFCEFLKKSFGADTLEENLEFIAKALGNKGNSSREIIHNYFLKDFFKDHCKIYQKRPIYWLFDSGKEDGFKALVYMHRYNKDTIGNLRIDYLHRMQRVYDNELSRMQETIDNSGNAREVAAATKRKEKLTKQLKETKEYDSKIAHLALARISIDLDDGVKVNYEKVQTGTDGEKLDVLAKI